MTDLGAPEIPLEQVAAVFAAEQEGFSLPEVLAIEGIDERAWPDVRMSSLMSVATDPNEHHRYTAALHEAQDRLHCDVAPLYDDVGGWVAFIVATEKTAYATLAAEHDLMPNDLSRLERHWRARFSGDAALSRQAQYLRSHPPPLPTLTVGERKLTPSPYAKTKWARRRAQRSDATPGRADV